MNWKKRVIVFGGHGQLGQCIKSLDYVAYDFVYLGHNDVDITYERQVEDYISPIKDDVIAVINCAAYTDVAGAENQRKSAIQVNSLGTFNVARVCKKYDIPLVHISTNYIFDGKQVSPYKETDEPRPINEYGRTKYAGELLIESTGCKYVIIRTGWIYSQFGSNFLTKILKKLDGNDPIYLPTQDIGAPTNGMDLARFVIDMMKKLITNNLEHTVYNFTNSGVCSWYDFGKMIAMFSDHELKTIVPVTDPTDLRVHRPQNSALDLTRVTNMNRCAPKHWVIALMETLKYGKYNFKLPINLR